MKFQFKIGQTVFHKGTFDLLAAAKAVKRLGYTSPPVFVIIERHAVECPGGTQHYYVSRHASTTGVGNDFLKFNEIELVPFDDKVKKLLFPDESKRPGRPKRGEPGYVVPTSTGRTPKRARTDQ